MKKRLALLATMFLLHSPALAENNLQENLKVQIPTRSENVKLSSSPTKPISMVLAEVSEKARQNKRPANITDIAPVLRDRVRFSRATGDGRVIEL